VTAAVDSHVTGARKSTAFQAFVAGVRAPMTWDRTDEYSGVGALHLLVGDERLEAEDILIERLTHNDGRARTHWQASAVRVPSSRCVPGSRARCLA
jgi:hypothetical protein